MLGNPRRQSLWATAALVLVLALLAAAIPRANSPAGLVSPERPLPKGLVQSISLPDAWPAIPVGPNQAQFQALCRLCHSPRLALTQPRLPGKKWAEVVHKMVAVYGAPIPAEQEREIVTYLTAVQGNERQP
jgi:hypothetical protein